MTGQLGLSEISSAEEYISKKEQVIAMFSKEFIKGFYYGDPILHSIVHLLVRGVDPYVIIEELIKHQVKLRNDFTDLVINSRALFFGEGIKKEDETRK